MAGLDVTPDAITKARSAGYSDDEIVKFLAPQAPEKFGAAIKSGYSPSEILQHLAPQDSGVLDSLKEGAANVVSGIGKTISAHIGANPVSQFLTDHGPEAPADYKAAPLIDSNGIHPSNIPARLAAMGPGMSAALLAARYTPGPWWLKAGVGAGAGWLMSAGNDAQTAADKRTGTDNAPITGADLARGDLTSAASNAVGALPITRFLPASGAVVNTGIKGVGDALKRYATTVGLNAAAGGGANAVEQAGQSVGTPGGAQVDPLQVADAAAGGGATGGLFGGKNLARESLNATKYSAITPELHQAATQVANRMLQEADGANLDAGVITGGKAQRKGAEVFNKTNDAIHTELNDAVGDLKSRVTLPVDANNVLNAALKGQQPTPRDYETLTNAVKGDPQADNVMNLLRQAHVADIVKNTGHLSDDKFTGGIAGHFGSILSGHNVGKSLLAGLGGAALEGGAGHIIAYSPEVLGVAAGASALARMMDNLTGARAPAGRFVKGFADGTTPVRTDVVQPPAPAAPVINRPGPTGPSIMPAPTPWGAPAPQTVDPRALAQSVSALRLPLRDMKARQAAAQSAATPQSAPAPVARPLAGGDMIPPAVRATMDSYANLQKLSAANRAAEEAKAAVATSPLIEQKVGGPAGIPTPDAAKQMSAALRGANIVSKLQSDPAQAAEDKAAAKDEAARAKAEAKAQTAAAKLAAKVAKVPAPKADNGKGPIDLPPTFAGALRTPEQQVLNWNAARAPAPPPAPTKVTKANGTTKTEQTSDEYVVPRSVYAGLVPSEAAKKILADAQRGPSPPKYPAGFQKGIIRNISAIRDRASAAASEVPGLDGKELAAQFEGVDNQKDAIRHRDWLAKQMPQAAASLNKFFTDKDIKSIWKRAGK